MRRWSAFVATLGFRSEAVLGPMMGPTSTCVTSGFIRAGIEKGDLIVAAAGEPVARVDDLQPRLDAAGPDGIVLTVVRGAEEREVTVALEPVAS